MKLYERLGDTGFHTSVISTFGIDFDAYENIALARLRGAGCRNNIVLADEGMLAYALAGASVLPRWAGRHYSVSGARARGVFHPKLFLQVGRRRGRLIVASANATAAGLAGNLELAGVVECTDQPSAEQGLISAAWQFLSRLLDRERQHLVQQIAWMEARAHWLVRAEPARQPVALVDERVAAFLATGLATGILQRFADLVRGESVTRLIVLSPYWDDDLAALRELVALLAPQETLVLIEPGRGMFPGPELHRILAARVLDIAPVSKGRFSHAKLIVASTAEADHVLFGSANCTVPALGTRGFAGTNEEACLYRRLPSGAVPSALGLAELLAEGSGLPPEILPPLARTEELPLADALRRHPGSFECTYETLTWWASESLLAMRPIIELLDKDGEVLACRLDPLSAGAGSVVRFRMTGAKDRPAFARLRFNDGTISPSAIVSSVEALITAARESQSKAAERARGQLDEETDIDLSLLEVLDDLEAAESTTTAPVSRSTSRVHHDSESRVVHRVLDYQSFLAGRTIRSERSVFARDSLAGSELSFVRAFLNRVLAVDAPSVEDADINESDLVPGLGDLGDETAEGGDAIERGESFTPPSEEPKKPPSPEELKKEAERRKAVHRRANREQLAAAVDRLASRLKDRANGAGVTAQDLLRVRAVLSILAAAGWSGRDAVRPATAHLHSERQVLPIGGSDDCWPRLLGRTLYALFGGEAAAVMHLKVDAIHDQIPDDVLECWATCFWAAQASVASCAQEPGQSFFLERLKLTVGRVYALTGLRPEEALGEEVLDVMQKLSSRYAERLGVHPEQILSAHRQSVMQRGREVP